MTQLRFAVTPVLCALCIGVIALVLQPAVARAQDVPIDLGAALTLPTIVVSPTLVPTPVSEIGNSVTVITADDMERKQERTLPDALKDVPGLNVVQTGGPGGQTSIFIRGTDSNHTKAVSYTHLDVYKRQTPPRAPSR